jgi:hypothetical protein
MTPAEMLKDALRFGPARDAPLDQSSLKGIKVGAWTSGRRISISEIDEQAAALSSDRLRPGIGTLSEIVISGRGVDYNAENTFGDPYWWNSDFGMPEWWREDGGIYGPRTTLKGETRRWALFCFRFRERKWSHPQGRAAERRGVEIAAALRAESEDVRRMAECLRDGKPIDWLAPQAEATTRARLEVLGLSPSEPWPSSRTSTRA